jgi:hypothetical protein
MAWMIKGFNLIIDALIDNKEYIIEDCYYKLF